MPDAVHDNSLQCRPEPRGLPKVELHFVLEPQSSVPLSPLQIRPSPTTSGTESAYASVTDVVTQWAQRRAVYGSVGGNMLETASCGGVVVSIMIGKPFGVAGMGLGCVGAHLWNSARAGSLSPDHANDLINDLAASSTAAQEQLGVLTELKRTSRILDSYGNAIISFASIGGAINVLHDRITVLQAEIAAMKACASR